MTLDIHKLIDFTKSLNEGCILDTAFTPGSWYWKLYTFSGLFDPDKPVEKYSDEELNLFLYGSRIPGGKLENPKITGLVHRYEQTYLNRDLSNMSKSVKEKAKSLTRFRPCSACHGKRLNPQALACKISGYSIGELCEMELTELLEILNTIEEPSVASLLESLKSGLQRLIRIGLPYLHLNRTTDSLSGGEAQRLKLVRYLGSSLSDMLYIFDEPSTGMHAHDVKRINQLLYDLKERGNTVIVVEHDRDVIQTADVVVDVGPLAGKKGGQIVFQGTYEELLKAHTLTGEALGQRIPVKQNPRCARSFFSIQHASMNNLRDVSVQIPSGILSVISGVAGSGKSTLISKVFAGLYPEQTIIVNQKPIFATGRSTPATFLGVFDEIRSLFTRENRVDKSFFSFNSKGACPDCRGKGVIVTELVHMSPVVTVCETCGGSRYSEYALSLRYRGKNILDVLSMNIEEALAFFEERTISERLELLVKVGLSYMTLVRRCPPCPEVKFSG